MIKSENHSQALGQTDQPASLSILKALVILGLFSLNTKPLSAKNLCREVCSDFTDDLQSHDEEIRRIQEIKEKNERFILSLDADQYSQKMKAESNIRVADRRISDLARLSKDLKTRFDQEGCMNCQKIGG